MAANYCALYHPISYVTGERTATIQVIFMLLAQHFLNGGQLALRQSYFGPYTNSRMLTCLGHPCVILYSCGEQFLHSIGQVPIFLIVFLGAGSRVFQYNKCDLVVLFLLVSFGPQIFDCRTKRVLWSNISGAMVWLFSFKPQLLINFLENSPSWAIHLWWL